MKNPLCDRWHETLDVSSDSETARELIEHIANCGECRDRIQKETDWENALRAHAETFTCFHWSPQNIAVTTGCDGSNELERPVLIAGSKETGPSMIRAALCLLLAGAAVLVGMLGIHSPQQRSGERAVARIAPAMDEGSERESTPRDNQATLTSDESLASNATTIVRSVESASHLSVTASPLDDGLTLVMLYPRVTRQTSESNKPNSEL